MQHNRLFVHLMSSFSVTNDDIARRDVANYKLFPASGIAQLVPLYYIVAFVL